MNFTQQLRPAQLPLQHINQNYVLSVHDNSITTPFIINTDLVKIIQAHTAKIQRTTDLAKSIFDWMQANITYKENKQTGYRTTSEIIQQRRGICGEMAILYITLARCCGLQSNYVSVTRDYDNKEVRHACAVVYPNQQTIYVDPAYNTYDIHHKKTETLTDKQLLEKFKRWRK